MQAPWLGWVGVACLGTSVFQEPLEFGIDEGEAIERRLVHGVDEVLVAVGQAWLLVQEVLVEVAEVSRGLLWAQGRAGEQGPRGSLPRFPHTRTPSGWAGQRRP